MNIGSIIGWLLQNTGFITTLIQAVETIASDLQNLHGNNSLDAYAKAILSAIEGFFQSIGANTSPTPTEQSTIAPHVQAAVSPVSTSTDASGSAP